MRLSQPLEDADHCLVPICLECVLLHVLVHSPFGTVLVFVR